MKWNIAKVASLCSLVMACACSISCAVGPLHPVSIGSGSISLPRGYRVINERNLDTPVVTGRIVSARDSIEIRYAIFTYGRTFASPNEFPGRNYTMLSSTSRGNGRSREIRTLVHDNILNVRKLYISFPEAGPANFIADVKTAEEIRSIGEIVGSFQTRAK